ncbi:MAG TPA: anaerobic ribonucleoside-triphosphate reductase [Candidatus Hydrogenedentes bacterium]|nr:anaerobic ribonucleoside-triphosphate reductase [Candidatus Hydrogenedentota bacterium]
MTDRAHEEEPRPEDSLFGEEGMCDRQLSLPFADAEPPKPLCTVVKADGTVEPFDRARIVAALTGCGGPGGPIDRPAAEGMANAVALFLQKTLAGGSATTDQVDDAVERVLIHMGHVTEALAFTRDRERRARMRRLREGDLRAVLREIREARAPEEPGGFDWAAVRVRDSQGGMRPWDRARIAGALVRETGLDRATADLVAVTVEEHVARAGITAPTTSLLRELAGAALVEQGLGEARERQQRLGVPLYDTARMLRGQTPETMHGTPDTTARVLAKALKREYALTEVFSQDTVAAHLFGDIHLHHLEEVDRLYSARLDLAPFLRGGLRVRGAVLAPPPESPDALLSQWLRRHALLEPLFCESLCWDGYNLSAAPFLAGRGDAELEQFARMVVYEFAHHALTRPDAGPAARLCAHWTPGPAAALREAVAPGGNPGGEPYDLHVLTAQRAACAVFSVLAEAAADMPLPEPGAEILLRAADFDGPSALEMLAPLGALMEAGGAAEARFDRGADEGPRVVAQRVSVNLPRAALVAEDGLPGLLRHLDGALAAAARAHAEKRRFVEELLVAGARGPLGLLAGGDAPPLRAEDLVFETALEGLRECLDLLSDDLAARERMAAEILARAGHTCRDQARRGNLRLALVGGAGGDVGRRFAALDAAAHPAPMAALQHRRPDMETPEYSPGVSLGDASSAGTPDRETALHAFLEDACIRRETPPGTALPLLAALARDTHCLAVRP